jgi:hypothetical protein
VCAVPLKLGEDEVLVSQGSKTSLSSEREEHGWDYSDTSRHENASASPSTLGFNPPPPPPINVGEALEFNGSYILTPRGPILTVVL